MNINVFREDNLENKLRSMTDVKWWQKPMAFGQLSKKWYNRWT